MAVFVVRYHNGPNIGNLRFSIVAEMTKEVIATFPKALNYGEYFSDQTTLKALNNAAERAENV